jgi:hypothetical protein
MFWNYYVIIFNNNNNHSTLGALAKLRKANIGFDMSVCLSFHPSVCLSVHIEQLGFAGRIFHNTLHLRSFRKYA